MVLGPAFMKAAHNVIKAVLQGNFAITIAQPGNHMGKMAGGILAFRKEKRIKNAPIRPVLPDPRWSLAAHQFRFAQTVGNGGFGLADQVIDIKAGNKGNSGGFRWRFSNGIGICIRDRFGNGCRFRRNCYRARRDRLTPGRNRLLNGRGCAGSLRRTAGHCRIAIGVIG